jgi:hypothetical protein
MSFVFVFSSEEARRSHECVFFFFFQKRGCSPLEGISAEVLVLEVARL